MATTNLGLPLIAGNNTADVVRDMNALANAVDGKAGAVSGLAKLDSGGKVPVTQLPAGTANGVASLDAGGTIPDAQIPAAITRDTELSAHTTRVDNPHSVTAAQVGAVPTTQKGAANGVASLGADGKVPSTQLPPSNTLTMVNAWIG